MNVDLIGCKINDDFKRGVVDCISMAFHDDLPRYLSEYHPETTNGVPHQINDWINTNIVKHLTSGDIEALTFTRHSWTGKLIVDRKNKITYSIMRGKRVCQLRREKREKPHYLQTIIAVLNDKLMAPTKQMTLFEIESGFDKETISKDYDSIMQGRINSDDGFRHCVIAYEAERNEIADIRMVFLDKDLDVIEQVQINDFVKPDFAKLTSVEPAAQPSDEEEQPSSVDLIALKKAALCKLW